MPYQLSCFTNSYGRFGPEAALRLLPAAGVRFVELPIKNSGVPSIFGETPLLTESSTLQDVERVRGMLDAAGLRLSSVNLSSGNPLEPAAVARTLRKLDLAEALGVTLVVGGGGEVRQPSERVDLWDQLRRIGDAAASRRIVYCCETHPGACQNAERMLEMVHAVDHPHVRLNFDTGNLYYYNRDPDLGDSLRSVAEFVHHVHLKDTPGGFEQWQFVELGTGRVDFAMVRTILDDVGFNGPYSIELEGSQGEPPPTLEEYQRRMLSSVSHLCRCGFLKEAN